jgi:hypothetical protein
MRKNPARGYAETAKMFLLKALIRWDYRPYLEVSIAQQSDLDTIPLTSGMTRETSLATCDGDVRCLDRETGFRGRCAVREKSH